MHFSYHTICFLFFPTKFNEAYSIGEYLTNEIDHKKEFPLEMKLVFFNQTFYLSIGEKDKLG
jgi:hypothetical protein